ncbi:alkaline phosphatase family protein, partial [Candidatus Bathyarchaeota archaeon]|nr:alkaline phosphatase family protein [Candidatus Bathyarchaeota archaeon]
MKVLVIGLDGATFELIRAWADELPVFKNAMLRGVFCDLISTIPPVSSPAWPSFMTGKNPGKHGVFDFVGGDGGYRREIKNSRDIQAETLWRLLSAEGESCIVLNVPVTYPPEPLKGCIVTGMLTPPDSCYAYPRRIHEELKRKGYDPVAKMGKLSAKGVSDFLANTAVRRCKAFTYLMNKFNWNFAMMVFRGTDIIQHHLWQKNKDEIFDYYKKLDSLIGSLIKRAGPNTNVILMSDHGFGPVFKFFHTNRFLQELGLITFERGPTSERYLDIRDYRPSRGRLESLLRKSGFTKEAIYSSAKRVRLLPLLQSIYRKIDVQVPTTRSRINWAQTKAFFNSSIGPAASIQINLEGREPKGTVKAEEYETTRSLILKKLLQIKDPETGQRLVQDAFRREEIYSGPFVQSAPDIVFLTQNFEYSATDRIYGKNLVSNPIHRGRGTHRMNGIFIAHGPDFRKSGERDRPVRIIDLTPTILFMFGAEIPSDMDGKVLLDIF